MLPLNVCIQCMTTLLSFHKLYLCCLKAKEHFESIVLTKNGTNRMEIQEPDKDVAGTVNLDILVHRLLKVLEETKTHFIAAQFQRKVK